MILRIVKFLEVFFLYLLIFLCPIFFLPFSFEFFEFNKIYLLFYTSFLVLILHLTRLFILEKKIQFLKTPFNLPLLIFFLSIFFSTLFAKDKITALFGNYGKFYDGAIFLFSLILFFFLLLNSEIKKEIAITLFLISGTISLISAFFSFFSLWQRIPLFSQIPYLQRNFNFTTPVLTSFSIFLLVLISLSVSILLSNFKKIFKIISFFLLIFLLPFYLLIDYNNAHYTFIISSIFLIFLSIKNRIFKEEVNYLLLPITLLLIFVFFSLFNIRPPIYTEISLNQKFSFFTTLNSLLNPKEFFVGSGPGSFPTQFLKEKPSSILKTELWPIRFDRPSNNIFELLVNLGTIGTGAFLALLILSLVIAFFRLERENIPYFYPLFTLIASQFFHYQNSILGFSLFLFLGLSIISLKDLYSEYHYDLKIFPELNLLFSSILLFLLLFFAFLIFFGVKFYLADYYFAKGWIIPEIEKKIEFFEKAKKFNPDFPYYRLSLSQAYYIGAIEEVQKGSQKSIEYATKAVREAGEATRISPYFVLSLENLAIIYRDIQGFENAAIETFKKELEADPKNPLICIEIVKLYLSQNNLKMAREYLEKAKKLQENIQPVKLFDAILTELEGKDEEAKNILNQALSLFPFDIEINFHLGRINYKQGNLDEAISYFERAISIFPNHSNSLFLLALSYEKKGDYKKALEYMERVKILNPENEEVKMKVEELKQKVEGKK